MRSAKAGGRADDAARATGDLAKAQAERDRLQKIHDALERLDRQASGDAGRTGQQRTGTGESERGSDCGWPARRKKFGLDLTLNSLAEPRCKCSRRKAKMAALEEKVRDGQITAPDSGTLYALPVKTGDYVKVGDLLAEMADLHKVRVRAFIDEPELGGLQPNEPVKITWDALPYGVGDGRTEIIPKAVVARGTRSVGELLCSVNNDALELMPNINVNVRINAQERKNVLSVPRGAVATENGRRYVFVVKQNPLAVSQSKLEKREIQVGIASATEIYEIMERAEGTRYGGACRRDFDLR